MPINVLDILCINVWTLHVPHVHGGERGWDASDFNFSRLRGPAHTETLSALNTIDRSVLTKPTCGQMTRQISWKGDI